MSKRTRKFKTVFVASILLAVFVTGIAIVTRYNRTSALQQAAEVGSVTWVAQEAAANGEAYVEISSFEWTYTDINGSDDARARYSVVLAQPLTANSYIWSDENQTIGTWYRFRVDEVLSQRAYTTCDICPPSPNPPTDLLPVNSNEILIPKIGGSLVVNGVTINSVEPDFPNYDYSTKYLLFIDLDTAKRVGVVAAGPVAVFTVHGDTVAPLTDASHPLASDFATRYGNSLNQTRLALQ
jgi:hypothetical protein